MYQFTDTHKDTLSHKHIDLTIYNITAYRTLTFYSQDIYATC